MKKEELILNTIVFKEQLDAGILQADLVKEAHSLGVRRLEIRREFLQNTAQELPIIRQKADAYHFDLFYSINEDLIVNGDLNPNLTVFLSEAQELQAPFVKLNIGDAGSIDSSVLLPLAELMSSYQLGIRLENNQTPGHASVANCVRIMDLVKAAGLSVSFVFDTANWIFVNQSLTDAVQKLSSVTTYLHCKNYHLVEGKPEVSSSLFSGEIAILELLQQFPHLDSVALEYPCQIDTLKKDIEQFIV